MEDSSGSKKWSNSSAAIETMKSLVSTLLCILHCASVVRAQELDCTLPDAVDISMAQDGSMLLRHVIHPVDETLTMELEWAGATGYLSIGFSATGAMVPAHAVIGLPNTGDVQKYDMVGKGLTDVIPVAQNALTATSIAQTDTTTILRFTQPLNDGVDPVVVTSEATNLIVIWAYGITNDLGMHVNRGSFFLTSPIPECTAAAVEAPVVEPSAPSVAQAATSEPTTLFPVAAPEEAAPAPEEPAAPPKPTAPTPASAPTPRAAATPTARTNRTDAAGNAPTPAGSMLVPTARDNATNAETEAPEQVENIKDSDGATLDCSPQADPLDMSVAQDGSLLLKQFIVHPVEQTVTIEVEWVGEAYLSLGFSKDGLMVPKVAIIGLPDTGDVQKYDMVGKTMETVTLSSAEQQTLTNASITQVDGITTLKYTKPLVDDGDEDVTPGASTRVIWAYGSTNSLGMHPARGFADFKLQTCLEVGTTAPPTTQSPTATPTAPPTTESPTVLPTVAATFVPLVDLGSGRIQRFIAIEKDKSEFTIVTDTVAGTITVDMVYEGLGYIAFGIGSTLYMPNAIAVVASPELNGGVPIKYDLGPTKAISDVTLSPLQTLTNASCVQNETHTRMIFTKLMVEGPEPAVDMLGGTPFLYAMGPGNDFGMHIIGSSFAMDLAAPIATGAPIPTSAPVATGAPAFTTNTSVPHNTPISTTNSFDTTIDTATQIPSRLRMGENMTVVEWPLNGAIRIGNDGTITYIPSLGFVGEDSFNVQICSTSQSCRFERLYVSVRAASSALDTAPEKRAPKRLSLLSLLGLVPLIAMAALVWQKRVQQETNTAATHSALPVSAPSTNATTNDAVPPHSAVAVAVTRRNVSAFEPAVASARLVQATTEALPDFKDQCRLEPVDVRLYQTPPSALPQRATNVVRVDSDDSTA